MDRSMELAIVAKLPSSLCSATCFGIALEEAKREKGYGTKPNSKHEYKVKTPGKIVSIGKRRAEYGKNDVADGLCFANILFVPRFPINVQEKKRRRDCRDGIGQAVENRTDIKDG